MFLVALGIDYNIFLTTRIREPAGLVLAGTFAALGTLPMAAFAEIGFAVALGVLLDAFTVRRTRNGTAGAINVSTGFGWTPRSPRAAWLPRRHQSLVPGARSRTGPAGRRAPV